MRINEIGRHEAIAWLGVAILLFLRIPFTIFLTLLYPSEAQAGPAIFQTSTYLFTAFLIWWERDKLFEFHIDTMTLAFILLFKPIQTLVLRFWDVDSPLTFPRVPALLIWFIALGLIVALWQGEYKPSSITGSVGGWLVIGLLSGLFFSSLMNLNDFHLDTHQAGHDYIAFVPMFSSIGTAFIYQLGFAAVSEEPLFRGFLWGYLRQLNWRENWIWLFQAVIFLFAHVYFMAALPFHFWVVIPISGLLFGLLAWRSRSLVPGMLAHAAYNASAYVVVFRLINSMAGFLR